MTNLIKYFLVFLVSLTMSNSTHSQEAYEVWTISMKPGMTRKGMDLGVKYLSGSLHLMGIETIALTAMTGSYSAIVLVPVPGDNPFVNRYPEMRPHMVKIAGSEEKFGQDMDMFNATIREQQVNIFKAIETSAFDAPCYMVRFVKFKKGHKQRCMKIGMKYFQKGNNNLGIKSKVLSAYSGPWDALIIEPRDIANPVADPGADKYYAEYRKIAGNEDELKEDLKVFMDGVSNEEIHYYRKRSKN